MRSLQVFVVFALLSAVGCQPQPGVSQPDPADTIDSPSQSIAGEQRRRDRPKRALSNKRLVKTTSSKSQQVKSSSDRDRVTKTKQVSTGTRSTSKPNPNWLRGDKEERARLRGLESSSRAPALQLSDWQNSQPLYRGHLEGKIVVLNFWATWCGPCIRSIDRHNELHRRYRDQGVVVIGVCNPDGSEQMQEVIRTHGIDYPVAVDSSKSTIGSYKVAAYPSYYLIDRDGVLRVADCRARSVEEAIDFLLDQQPDTGARTVTQNGNPNGVRNPFFD